MKTKSKTIYVCEYCGEEYSDYSSCEVHEDECRKKAEAVKIILYFCGYSYKLITDKTRMRKASMEEEEVVRVADDDCDHFTIFSRDTSEENIKRLKEKIVQDAITIIKNEKERSNTYYSGLIEKLESNCIIDEPYVKE